MIFYFVGFVISILALMWVNLFEGPFGISIFISCVGIIMMRAGVQVMREYENEESK